MPKNLTFRAQIPSSGPVFSTGAMGRIPITLSVQDSLSLNRVLNRTNGHCELVNSDQFGLNASTFDLSEILQAANQLMVATTSGTTSNHNGYALLYKKSLAQNIF